MAVGEGDSGEAVTVRLTLGEDDTEAEGDDDEVAVTEPEALVLGELVTLQGIDTEQGIGIDIQVESGAWRGAEVEA